jgi:hypothetical protein
LNQQVTINVTDTPAVANIVRGGFQVPVANINATEVAKVLGDYTIVTPKDLPRVLSQSIAAGVKVAAGTAIDLNLAPRNRIPFTVFQGAHVDLLAKTLDDISPIASNSALRKTLLTYDTAADVPQAERTLLESALKGIGVTVDDTQAGKSFSQAFEATRGAMAFFE